MIQTRNEHGEIDQWETLQAAFNYASLDPEVWKISFSTDTGEPVRLIKTDQGWLYETVFGDREVAHVS